jgi:hypothetical protein
LTDYFSVAWRAAHPQATEADLNRAKKIVAAVWDLQHPRANEQDVVAAREVLADDPDNIWALFSVAYLHPEKAGSDHASFQVIQNTTGDDSWCGSWMRMVAFIAWRASNRATYEAIFFANQLLKCSKPLNATTLKPHGFC